MRKIVVALLLSLVTLALSAAPVLAWPASSAPANEFTVIANGDGQAFPWAGERSCWYFTGQTLAEDATVIWQVLPTDGWFKLVIPAGTKITGFNNQYVYFLEMTIYHGYLTLRPGYVFFSQPVTLFREAASGDYSLKDGNGTNSYQLLNEPAGGWTKLITFTKIANGIAK